MGKKRKGRLRQFQRTESEISTSKARQQRQERIQKLKEEEQNRPNRKKKKPVLNRARIIACIVILLVGAVVGVSLKNIISLKIEQSRLEKENQKLTQEKKDLEEELENIGSKEYIEKEAREVLKMVKPNEKLFIIEDGKE